MPGLGEEGFRRPLWEVWQNWWWAGKLSSKDVYTGETNPEDGPALIYFSDESNSAVLFTRMINAYK